MSFSIHQQFTTVSLHGIGGTTILCSACVRAGAPACFVNADFDLSFSVFMFSIILEQIFIQYHGIEFLCKAHAALQSRVSTHWPTHNTVPGCIVCMCSSIV